MIDLRSDTVTRPSRAMLAAMLDAETGDDVWGDDPTVLRLQSTVAERAGKEAGLFFPSGTQSNLAALMAHCARGDEYIVGQLAHTYKYEGGGAAVLGSIQPQPLENAPDGTLPLAKIAAAIKPIDNHFARTRLLALENTIGGKVLPESYVAQAVQLARQHGLSAHLDGARVFNAAVASGKPVAALCEPFDSVSICFSKGLGAPVGSVLVSTAERIAEARVWRKRYGAGMRQAGILAAAGLYALEHHLARLADDHERARRLGAALGADPATIDTNIVVLDVADAAAVTTAAAAQGVLVSALGPRFLRLVTHLDVDDDGIDRAIAVLAPLIGE